MQISRMPRDKMSMDMSPMIDCVFQLLIFFMLSSTFLTPALELTLPETSNEASPEAPEIIVTLSKDGEVFINTEPVSLETLRARLPEVVAQSKQKVVTIRGDSEMPYDFFVQALSAAQTSGAIHVNIAHDWPGGGAR